MEDYVMNKTSFIAQDDDYEEKLLSISEILDGFDVIRNYPYDDDDE